MSVTSRENRGSLLKIGSRRKKQLKSELWQTNKKCGICGKDLPGLDKSTLDHIVPLSKGGDCSLGNLQLAHWQCNNAKGCKI